MIDLHCDTVGRLAAEGNDGSLLKNSYSVDVERLEKENTLLQCFSTFFDAGAYPEETREEQSYITANRMIDIFDENVKLCGGRLLQVKTYEDILKCQAENKVGGLLTFEDGVSVGHDMKNLHYFYDRGIRLITLTWNYENAIGYPNSTDPETMSGGLKPFGVEMIREMERLGMVVDVSHLSDGGFWDTVKYSRKPFIASHSNSRAVTSHPRNMTDDMIHALAEKGGVMGLNLCPAFLSDDEKSTIPNMVRHIMHIWKVGGEDILALGGDLDGIGGDLEIKSCGDMWRLREALQEQQMPSRVIDKMWQGNALRVMKEVLS